MIIEGLMTIVKSLLSILFVFNIPGLPEEFNEAFNVFIGLFEYGIGLFALYFPISITGFVTVWVAVQVFKKVYPLIMWVLRKIPMLNIN